MPASPIPSTEAQLSAIAAELLGLPPRCGPVRLVAVDGHAGSGKTTFAEALGAALGGAPVIHLDDLATHEQLFDWSERLNDEVLRPLARGETARHRVYDWEARRFLGVREIPPAPVVLVEGVGAGRRALRPRLSGLLWLDLPAAVARARGEARDGPAQAEFWRGWVRAEAAHFAADPSRPFADLFVDTAAGIRADGSHGYQLSAHCG
ncbi:uridine kinase [Streptacidiphilus sp. EB129]|uniref:uridine kinase family protein n=1 Tax=Streptacidiphilus sp. EB129 TaxID=3156262 RepID=UPI003519BD53